MEYKLSNRSLGRIYDIDSILIKIIKASITDSPFDFGIPQMGGKRTAEDQHYLYLRKVSQLDGYKKKSYHQTGRAFDIYLYINGKASWNRNKLEKVAKHIIKVALNEFQTVLTWGGDWDGDGTRVDKDEDEHFFDGAHFQY